MRRLDELHLEFPYAGSRMLRDHLRLEGHQIGRKRASFDAKDRDRCGVPEAEATPSGTGQFRRMVRTMRSPECRTKSGCSMRGDTLIEERSLSGSRREPVNARLDGMAELLLNE
jgi:hypothetical protein